MPIMRRALHMGYESTITEIISAGSFAHAVAFPFQTYQGALLPWSSEAYRCTIFAVRVPSFTFPSSDTGVRLPQTRRRVVS